jgi:hypothetical protein
MVNNSDVYCKRMGYGIPSKRKESWLFMWGAKSFLSITIGYILLPFFLLFVFFFCWPFWIKDFITEVNFLNEKY